VRVLHACNVQPQTRCFLTPPPTLDRPNKGEQEPGQLLEGAFGLLLAFSFCVIL